MNSKIKADIKAISEKYSLKLISQIKKRTDDMQIDINDHYLIYRVLGIEENEGKLIDLYQNKGRFLYKYAGTFLEEVTLYCFKHKFKNAQTKIKIINTIGKKPIKFEIDCLVGNKAYEIKWRDATTDGDHITKEHTRLKCIKDAGYTPIRIMFYYPNRDQAKRIQSTLKTLYLGLGGQYYCGDDTWNYILSETGINLLENLKSIALEKEGKININKIAKKAS